MDRSLWLLLGMIREGKLRRWSRNLRTLKGALLAMAGALFLLPSVLSVFLIPRIQIAGQIALIRQYGPLGLLAYCLLNIVLSAGERAIYYSPGEVNYLFCGPFRSRQLLVYKVVGNVSSLLFATAFATLFLRLHTVSSLAAFVGLLLAFEMMFLLSVAVSLFAGMVGELAFNRQRKLLLLGSLVLIAVALVPRGAESATDPGALLRRVVESPVTKVVEAPFRPFVLAFTAQRVWPDLCLQGALAVALDLALLGVVIGLNHEFLEVSARVSAQRYALLQRARRGAVLPGARAARIRLPMVPWFGGVGPNLWRQLTTAARSGNRIVALLFLFVCPLLLIGYLAPRDPELPQSAIVPAFSVLGSLAVFAPTMIGYDFRPDLVRMAELKTLPIRPLSLALGQLATPVLIITAAQSVGLGVIASLVELPRGLLPAALLLGAPLNFVLVGIENLFFLWFPTRFIPGTAADFQMMGRQFLLMMGRLFCGLLAAGVAAGLGAIAFFASGERWAPALASGWLGLSAVGLGLVPLIAQAFRHFDVARDRLE